ncbi:hypothetical protein TSAR_001695 [Trichomalopsis sarcophagae]|uniref:Uncharacterized protein n=1 Tax=Trichomalopsis sarcophagae TaxID=543379 RepID=A0A232F5I6_9HYME|nr:hypothetical protein TSAR_001695 [Trichomalopsis sarcophagae]
MWRKRKKKEKSSEFIRAKERERERSESTMSQVSCDSQRCFFASATSTIPLMYFFLYFCVLRWLIQSTSLFLSCRPRVFVYTFVCVCVSDVSYTWMIVSELGQSVASVEFWQVSILNTRFPKKKIEKKNHKGFTMTDIRYTLRGMYFHGYNILLRLL